VALVLLAARWELNPAADAQAFAMADQAQLNTLGGGVLRGTVLDPGGLRPKMPDGTLAQGTLAPEALVALGHVREKALHDFHARLSGLADCVHTCCRCQPRCLDVTDEGCGLCRTHAGGKGPCRVAVCGPMPVGCSGT
jgi:hypothetical protein